MRSSLAVAPVIAERPSPGLPRSYRFPRFTRHRLPNSLELIITPIARLPVVSVRVLVDAGASSEELDSAGVATLTARSLAEGTERLDAASLAVEFERLGGSMTTYVTWDDAGVTTTVLRDRFEAVVALLADVITSPAIPDREITRLREERLAELLELRAEPRGLADEMFESLLYSPTSRFARPEGGSSETVKKLSREKAKAFHGARFRPSATTIIVAGDVDVEHAIRHVADVFGRWEGMTTPAPKVVTEPARTDCAIHVIGREGAPQTELRVGHVGLPRPHDDYFAATIMNAILGGLFNSRINLNLRERHAFTYGASSAFDWRRNAGPFVISSAVATEATGPAIREIIGEIQRMRESAPAPEELSLAASYLDGVFPIRFETTEAITAALTALKVFGLPHDYFDTYRANIRGVTSSEVERVAQQHLHPEVLQIVAVGDPSRMGPELEALNLGPVSYRDADGALISR